MRIIVGLAGSVLAALLSPASPALLSAAAAAPRTLTIEVTDSGLSTPAATIGAGDAVQFLNSSNHLAIHVQSTSGGWSYDERASQRARTPPHTFTAPGRYSYLVTEFLSNARYTGTVTVRAPAPSPTPHPSPSPPQPSPTPPVPSASTGPPPGVAPTPSLGAGFGGGAPSAPASERTSPAPPQLAPMIPGPSPASGSLTIGPLPSEESAAPQRSVAEPVGLTRPDSTRGLGLPAVVAFVLIGGVGAGLVRVLLAEDTR